MVHEIREGAIVRHFKWETLSDTDKACKKYMYEVLATATHTEPGEKLVVYRALYADADGVYQVYARPYTMFMAEVDHMKYPSIRQKYRFEEMYKC